MATQDEINKSEWNNADNWGASGTLATIVSVYFSKKDSRTWVPKKDPSLGWTVNLAHRSGVLGFLGVLIGLPLFITLVFIVIITRIVSGS